MWGKILTSSLSACPRFIKNIFKKRMCFTEEVVMNLPGDISIRKQCGMTTFCMNAQCHIWEVLTVVPIWKENTFAVLEPQADSQIPRFLWNVNKWIEVVSTPLFSRGKYRLVRENLPKIWNPRMFLSFNNRELYADSVWASADESSLHRMGIFV